MERRLPLNQHVDILAIGACPRDAEIGVGGILLKMAHRGYTTVICDLTNDETIQTAPTENFSLKIEKAGRMLRLSDRISLNIEYKDFKPSLVHSQALAECLCLYRPDVILSPYWEDLHPDICTASQIVQKAFHLTHLKMLDASYQPYTPEHIFYYSPTKPITPHIVVNITSTFEGKMESIKAYQSQNKENPLSSSLFSQSSPDNFFHIESRARYFGSLINCRFGEGLIVDKPIIIEDICEFSNL